jgi:hypothetical protein
MNNPDAIKMLREGLRNIVNSEDFQKFLAFRSRFHRYSWQNSILIACQRPEASYVAGYRRWESMGRHVRHHEKAIRIWAPLLCSRKIEKEGEEKTVKSVCGFRTVCVFDIGQTDGAPVPQPPVAKLLQGNDDGGLFSRLVGFLNKRGVTVRLERPRCEGANGEYDREEKVVRISPDLAPAQRAKTTAHEAGHALLHDSADISRSVAETEAEAVAFLVTARFGIESGQYSFPYIGTWSAGKIEMLEESLCRIDRAYREIVAGCDAATEAA